MRLLLALAALCAASQPFCQAAEDAFAAAPLPNSGLCEDASAWKTDDQAQSAQPSVFSGRGPAVSLPCLFWKGGPEFVSWDVASGKLDLTQARLFSFFARYDGDPVAVSEFSISFKGLQGARTASFAPGPVGVWTKIQIDKADLMVSGSPGGWRDVSSVSIGVRRGATQGSGTLSIASFSQLSAHSPETVLLIPDASAKDAPSWASEEAARRSSFLAAALDSSGVRFDVLSDIDVDYERLSLYKLVVLAPGACELDAKTAQVLQSGLNSGGALVSFGALPSELASRMGLSSLKTFSLTPPDCFEGWTSLEPGYPKLCKRKTASAAFFKPLSEGKAKAVARWVSSKQNAGAPSLGSIFAGPGYVHFSEPLASTDWAAATQALRGAISSLAPGVLASSAPASQAQEKPVSLSGRKMYFRFDPAPPSNGWNALAENLVARGFDSLAVRFSSGFVAYHPSSVLQRAEGSSGDELAACLAACRKAGLKFLVWREGLRLDGDGSDSAARLAEGLQVSWLDGAGRNETWLCPSRKNTRTAETDYFAEIVGKYKPDGIVADLRLPSRRVCFCPVCRSLFENGLAGQKIEKWPGDVLEQPVLAKQWRAFRFMLVGSLLEKISMDARQISQNPDFEVDAIVEPASDAADEDAAQDWLSWRQSNWVSSFILRRQFGWRPYSEALLKRDVELASPAALLQGVDLSLCPTPCALRSRLEAAASAQALGVSGAAFFDKEPYPDSLFSLLLPGKPSR